MQRSTTQRNATQRNATQRNATQRNATQRNATYARVLVSFRKTPVLFFRGLIFLRKTTPLKNRPWLPFYLNCLPALRFPGT